jgi:hypothetical protein
MSEGSALLTLGLPHGSALVLTSGRSEGLSEGMLEGLSEGSAEGELDAMTLGAALLEGEPDGLPPLALPEGWTLDGIPAGWILVEGELDGLILVENSPLEEGVLVEVEIDRTLLGARTARGRRARRCARGLGGLAVSESGDGPNS